MNEFVIAPGHPRHERMMAQWTFEGKPRRMTVGDEVFSVQSKEEGTIFTRRSSAGFDFYMGRSKK